MTFKKYMTEEAWFHPGLSVKVIEPKWDTVSMAHPFLNQIGQILKTGLGMATVKFGEHIVELPFHNLQRV